jgi:hypothetical protein
MEVFMKMFSPWPEHFPGAARFRGRQKRGIPPVLLLGVVLVLFGRCDLPHSPLPAEKTDLENAGEQGEGGKTPEAAAEEAAAEEEAAPEEPVLSAIEVSAPPDKMVYAKGEALDLRGLRVTGVYTDGASRLENPSALQFSGYDPDRTGEQRVVVSLQGKTAEFTVRVGLSELNLSLSLPIEEELELAGLPPGVLALSRSGAGGLPRELLFSAAGYEPLFCFIDGRPLALEAAGEGEAGFVLDAAGFRTGWHYLTLIGFTGGLPRSGERVLNISE